MTVQEWAERLNGIEYPADELDNYADELKKDGIMVIFGYSSDLLVFAGVINAEINAWDGTVVYIGINNDGDIKIAEIRDLFNDSSFSGRREYIKKIISIRAPQNEKRKVWASWHITSHDIEPAYSFDIMEDGELFCRGILFETKELDK
jgi:hypothetical protein